MSHSIFQNQDLAVLQAEFGCQFQQAINNLSANHDSIVVALPGGRSVAPFLRELVDHSSDIEQRVWSKIHFFLVDERVVGLDENESNFRELNKIFFEPLTKKGVLVRSQLHSLNFNRENPSSAVNEYATQLKKLGGVVHIAVVGVGEDGHVASLFPHHPGLKSSDSGFIVVENSPKPPLIRVSMSVALLKAAMQVFVLFIGEGKKDALLKYLDPKENYENCPAKIFAAGRNSKVFTDIDIKM